MTTMTWGQGAKSAVTITLAGLTSGSYVAGTAIDFGTAIPYDVTFEVEVTPSAATSGGKQLLLFAQLSLDGTNYSTGPTTGTSPTNEADLHFIGSLPCNDNGVHRKQFSLSGLPTARYLRLVARNDMGVTITSGSISRADIAANSA